MALKTLGKGRDQNIEKHYLTHSYFRVPPESVLWTYDTFDHNFKIENGFTKYLKEICR